ncbi:hypothetical protein [Chitinophaga sancti]|uniref:Uncharacterized protein n=1 Tax=Chitinophaga sancti TaxID=1004 RepID=A0A1K1T336_9BACT|nr:hypothetical protein [Chitinophaga sancti]WQD61433.1 hypothetical protein U0033_26510 [Chitinophaga sancti]WQD61771.1 hypothetical protein U0033_28215 [Chitinophaga sancti]WQG92660.1 hypothetical protein SR876_14170 [Chitinophaga sancti]WQG93014.1 hypothetical protein SR876_15950 [Chitinophaga sancti]SFW90987.1 hypothetical protein SAMN05661012_06710 [Chitinophaga sancti]
MERKEGFEKIQQLLPIIYQYYQTREIPATFDEEKKKICADVYSRFVLPGAIFPGFNCRPCVISVFELIESFWNREFPKYQQEQQKEANTANINSTETTISLKEIKPEKKARNNKK